MKSSSSKSAQLQQDKPSLAKAGLAKDGTIAAKKIVTIAAKKLPLLQLFCILLSIWLTQFFHRVKTNLISNHHQSTVKNDQRNSWGTLRQKFNPIDIWHLIFDIWHFIFDIWYLTFDIWHLTFYIEPMDQWTHWPMDQWTNGSLGQWTNGPMGQWTTGPMDQLCIFIVFFLLSWTYLNVGTLLGAGPPQMKIYKSQVYFSFWTGPPDIHFYSLFHCRRFSWKILHIVVDLARYWLPGQYFKTQLSSLWIVNHNINGGVDLEVFWQPEQVVRPGIRITSWNSQGQLWPECHWHQNDFLSWTSPVYSITQSHSHRKEILRALRTLISLNTRYDNSY